MDESRKQFFEFAKKQNLSLAYGDCGYVYSSTEMAWRAWQASRAAIEIKLDDKVMAEDDFGKGHNCAIDYCADAIRAAMLQSRNFRENKNSSTNNFREIAETSTNYPVIPSEVLSAILKVAKIRADFDDFDGDRRGIGDCLDEAEQELIVTINKYASQLAAEPIAPNDVREQTAIPQVPVTPDGWISYSERMPNDGQEVVVQTHSGWRYIAFYESHSGLFYDSPDGDVEYVLVTHWMPLPEPPQEVNRG